MNFETMIQAVSEAEKEEVSKEIGRLIDDNQEDNLITFTYELIQRISLLDTRSVSKSVAQQMMAKLGSPRDYFVEKAGENKDINENMFLRKLVGDLERMLGCMLKNYGKLRITRSQYNNCNVLPSLSYDAKRDCLVIERKGN